MKYLIILLAKILTTVLSIYSIYLRSKRKTWGLIKSEQFLVSEPGLHFLAVCPLPLIPKLETSVPKPSSLSESDHPTLVC
jgi:hypothetical protein